MAERPEAGRELLLPLCRFPTARRPGGLKLVGGGGLLLLPLCTMDY